MNILKKFRRKVVGGAMNFMGLPCPLWSKKWVWLASVEGKDVGVPGGIIPLQAEMESARDNLANLDRN